VAIVNNDVELEPDWLERLIGGAEENGAWFATGKIYRAGMGQRLDATFDAMSRAACSWRCGSGRQDGPQWSVRRAVWCAPLTAAVFRREVFERVGWLDEALESYLEDADLGLRCALAGLEGRYVPEAVAYHLGSATLGEWHPEKVRLIARNQVLLVAKHFPEWWWIRLGWPVLVGQLLWSLVALRHGAGLAYWRGKIEGLRRFRQMRRQSRGEARIGMLLEENEKLIQELQRQDGGYDWYWRWYFALT
jgi:GT2 family glycosyltransferase